MDNNSYYHIYVRTSCPFCKDAVDLLEKKKLKFVVTVLDKCPEYGKKIQEKHAWQTVPVVLYCEGEEIILIGGFTDLEKHLSEEE